MLYIIKSCGERLGNYALLRKRTLLGPHLLFDCLCRCPGWKTGGSNGPFLLLSHHLLLNLSDRGRYCIVSALRLVESVVSGRMELAFPFKTPEMEIALLFLIMEDR